MRNPAGGVISVSALPISSGAPCDLAPGLCLQPVTMGRQQVTATNSAHKLCGEGAANGNFVIMELICFVAGRVQGFSRFCALQPSRTRYSGLVSSREQDATGQRPHETGETQPLFTIGYGARTLEELIATLQANRVEFLIDVRTSPYSKFKPEFAKEVLQIRLERAGIRYLFMGDTLGGQPREEACQTDGKVDYDKVRAQPFFKAGIERLRKAFEQNRRAALMCSEGRPEQCHRSKLIGEALATAGIPVCHIDEDGALLTQTQVIDRLTRGQMDLFGQPSFTSRKRYGPRENGNENSRP